MGINGDHLGNVRLTYKDLNNNGSISSNEIIEEKNYYPFGLQHKGYNYDISANVNPAASQFGYNGKEGSSELGLETLDFGARNYDPAIGRWMNIDPLAEMMRRHSPYNFAFNNPVFYIDPDGMAPTNTNYADNGGTQSAFNFGDEEEEELEEEKEENENDSSHSQSANNGSDSNSDISDDSKDQSSSNNDCETPFDCFLQKFINALSFDRSATIEDAENKSDDYAEILDKVEKMADDSETIFSIYVNTATMMTPGLGLVGNSTFKAASGGSILFKTQGGLNLFKWGASQTSKKSGWRVGDYFLNLPNKGSVKLNWKANYGALRREMGFGKPIYDTYLKPNGALIPTNGFLNAERYILKSKGWNFNLSKGAWLPPKL